MSDLDTDMTLARELYESVKINRRCRNHQHKLIRNAKVERNDLATETKEYISKVQVLKDQRNTCNLMAQEFKQLRNDAIINLRAAKKAGNTLAHERFNVEQIKMHDKMTETATTSQEYQLKIEEINLDILKTSEQCNSKQGEIDVLFTKAEAFHNQVVTDIRAIDMIKEKHDIDFIEYGEEE